MSMAQPTNMVKSLNIRASTYDLFVFQNVHINPISSGFTYQGSITMVFGGSGRNTKTKSVYTHRVDFF